MKINEFKNTQVDEGLADFLNVFKKTGGSASAKSKQTLPATLSRLNPFSNVTRRDVQLRGVYTTNFMSDLESRLHAAVEGGLIDVDSDRLSGMVAPGSTASTAQPANSQPAAVAAAGGGGGAAAPAAPSSAADDAAKKRAEKQKAVADKIKQDMMGQPKAPQGSAGEKAFGQMAQQLTPKGGAAPAPAGAASKPAAGDFRNPGYAYSNVKYNVPTGVNPPPQLKPKAPAAPAAKDTKTIQYPGNPNPAKPHDWAASVTDMPKGGKGKVKEDSFAALNQIFESIIALEAGEETAQPKLNQGLSISEWLATRWWPSYMHGINYEPYYAKINQLFHEIQQSWPRIKDPMTRLAQLAYAIASSQVKPAQGTGTGPIAVAGGGGGGAGGAGTSRPGTRDTTTGTNAPTDVRGSSNLGPMTLGQIVDVIKASRLDKKELERLVQYLGGEMKPKAPKAAATRQKPQSGKPNLSAVPAPVTPDTSGPGVELPGERPTGTGSKK